MEAIIRCKDLLSEFDEREKKESAISLGKKRESANSLRVSSHGLKKYDVTMKIQFLKITYSDAYKPMENKLTKDMDQDSGE